MRTIFLAIPVVFVPIFACSSGGGGAAKTPDGGTIYTSVPPDNIPCTTDSDCCVVTDQCRSAAYVVHAGDVVDIPKPPACNLCMVPPVQVWCRNGVCQSGELTSLSADTMPFTQDHCGSLPMPDGGSTLIGPDGGVTTMAAYGCNP